MTPEDITYMRGWVIVWTCFCYEQPWRDFNCITNHNRLLLPTEFQIHRAMKQNLVVLLADLFNVFEIHPAKCVCYPGMEQQQVTGEWRTHFSHRLHIYLFLYLYLHHHHPVAQSFPQFVVEIDATFVLFPLNSIFRNRSSFYCYLTSSSVRDYPVGL